MQKIYVVNGFMDSGKTTFIKELFGQSYFDTGEKTLLILCEDGMEEYDVPFCNAHNIVLKRIESEADFSEETISFMEKQTEPDRIIVEYNGMWNPADKFEQWKNEQYMEIVIIDAQTFDLYLNNLKPYVTQQLRNAYMTLFRSCDGKENRLASYRRSVRAVNPSTNFVFKNAAGEMNPRLDEDLPYDIKKNWLDLSDDAFGVFYIDAMEYVKRYVGKEIHFIGKIFQKKKNMLLIGRKAMTCCMEDLATFALICDIADTEQFPAYCWVDVEGEVTEEYIEKMHVTIPVIRVSWIEKCEKPYKEIIEVK